MAARKASLKKSKNPKKRQSVKKNSAARTRFDNRWLLRVGACLVILTVITSIVFIARMRDVHAREAAATPQFSQQLTVTKLSWKDNIPATPKMYKPNKQDKLVSVSTEIVNNQSRNIWFAPSIESYIQDAAGTHFGMALAELSNPFIAGEYTPGQAAAGDLSYAVPKNIQNPTWCYVLAQSSGGGGPVCVALNQYSQAK